MWDPQQYAIFSEQRSRPFYDLFKRLEDSPAATIVDLGCGSGDLTRLFAKRWRNSSIVGVDSSPEMLAIAESYAIPGRLRFEQADIADWAPPAPVELLFSNAALYWLPDHPTLIPRLAAMVAPRGRFAVQMPGNTEAASHQLIEALLGAERWSDRLGSLRRREPAIRPLAWYVETLLELGFKVDAWETTYLHVLEGQDAALEWLKGTTLRPVLARLDTPSQQAFLAELKAGLDAAYPPGPYGTLFPFRRVFFLATRLR